MAAAMSQVNLSFYAKYWNNNLFISATTYEKNVVCKEHCIVDHDAQM